MLSAAKMSEAIRMKRKKVKDEGVDNMLDTAPGPQMNPQDIIDLKTKAQWGDTMDLPEKISAPSDPADADISGTSQDKKTLTKRMAMVKAIFDKL